MSPLLAPRSLFLRILLVVEAVFIVCVAGVSWQSSRAAETLLLRAHDEQAQAMARYLDGAVTLQREGMERQMDVIVGMRRLVESAYYADIAGEPQDLKRAVDSVVATGIVGGIEISDAGGRRIYSTAPGRARGVRERELIARAAKGTPLSVQLLRDGGRFFLFSSRPIYLGDASAGRARAMTCSAWQDLDSIWVHGMAARAGMPISLLIDGRVAASSLDGVAGQLWLDPGVFDSWPRTITVALDGEGGAPYRMQVTPLSSAEEMGGSVLLAVGGSLAMIYGELSRTRRFIIALSLAVGLGVFILMAWALSLLTPPLRRLIQASEVIADKGPESFVGVDVRPSDPEEIQLLAGHFNRMAAALKERVVSLMAAKEELNELNRELEQRVAVKTSEVEHSMKVAFRAEKMASVGQLAAGVAHEINNPLGVILGFAQAALRRRGEDATLALPLQSIEREALRCKTLVQNLLSFSRHGVPSFVAVDLRKAVEAALPLVVAQARVRSVTVRLEAGGEGLCIEGDFGQIQQVIINLSTNAIDAMPEGGSLTVRLTRDEAAPGYARIEIQDTGGGIPEDVRARIFDPFFTTKPPGQGTGLGLSLVHEIIMRHSGKIDFDSVPGKGTVFRVLFPLAVA